MLNLSSIKASVSMALIATKYVVFNLNNCMIRKHLAMYTRACICDFEKKLSISL